MPFLFCLILIIELVVVLILVVLIVSVLVIVILVVSVLVVIVVIFIFILVIVLIVSVVFVVHKNHPAFSIIVSCLRGDYSCYKFYKFNIFLAFFAVNFKMFSLVVFLISAIFCAVRLIIPEWQSLPLYGSGAR